MLMTRWIEELQNDRKFTSEICSKDCYRIEYSSVHRRTAIFVERESYYRRASRDSVAFKILFVNRLFAAGRRKRMRGFLRRAEARLRLARGPSFPLMSLIRPVEMHKRDRIVPRLFEPSGLGPLGPLYPPWPDTWAFLF